MEKYLGETYFLDYSNKVIQSLVEPYQNLPLQDKLSGWFLKVRDGWRYNPFTIYVKREKFKASHIAQNSEGHCIDKSTLFVAGLRALNIPARIRLAKVANHIAVESLVKRLGNNTIAPHGIAEVYFEGKWLKVSTAFNKTLCNKYNVDALEFDGTEDAMLQSFNRDKQEFMEYLEDYGHFADVPFEFILKVFEKNYPQIYNQYKSKDKLEL